jgi:threonine synthase
MSKQIRYKSTRGKQSGLSFEEVVLGGLATDKGLYIPETIPTFTADRIEKVSMGECIIKFIVTLFLFHYPFKYIFCF